jgi:hypothetical protein
VCLAHAYFSTKKEDVGRFSNHQGRIILDLLSFRVCMRLQHCGWRYPATSWASFILYQLGAWQLFSLQKGEQMKLTDDSMLDLCSVLNFSSRAEIAKEIREGKTLLVDHTTITGKALIAKLERYRVPYLTINQIYVVELNERKKA